LISSLHTNDTTPFFRNRKSNLCYPLDDDDNDIAEESDAVVPDGVEEVELAKIHVEVKERERKILFDDIRILCTGSEVSGDPSQSPKSDDATSVVTGSKSMLVCLRLTIIACS
jgi:hypothetical protein